MNERSRELIGYIDVNSKIRELAERSGCKIDKLGYGEGNLEKFAELIVQECANAIQSDMDRETINGTISLAKHAGMVSAKTSIKKHFGVE